MPTLDHLYLAYRQVKSAMFFERRGVGLVALAEFESRLSERLAALADQLSRNGGWFDGLPPGESWIVPKRIRRPSSTPSDVISIGTDSKQPGASGLDIQLRYSPSVETAIVEALFLWKFGPRMESRLSPNALGYRLDVRDGKIRPTHRWLFDYWPRRYQQFRTDPLDVSSSELAEGRQVLVLSADLASFYDSIDPSFLLSDEFLEDLREPSDKDLDFDEAEYREAALSLLRLYSRYRDEASRKTGLEWSMGIPIGCLTSRLVANVALATLDRAIEGQSTTLCYRRYVDDLVLVCRARPQEPGDIGDAVSRHIPHIEQIGGEFHLNGEQLARPGSDFRIQRRKCRAHHLGGVAGLSFIQAIRKDFGRLVSEQRAFLDASVTLERAAARLVQAGAPGRPLTVLREADRAKLEHFSVSTTMRSLERATVLIDESSARELASRTLEEINRFLEGDGDWVEHLELAFRLLRLGVRTRDWRESGRLVAQMDAQWGDLVRLRSLAGPLFHRDREVDSVSAWVSLRNYLHARRSEAISSSIRVPRRSTGFPAWLKRGVIERTSSRTWRGFVRHARLLAAADLRAYDREDDAFGRNPEESRFDASIHISSDDRALEERFALIEEFRSVCQELGDRPWQIAPARLFLCTRPPSYFDISHRLLYQTEDAGFSEHAFDRLLQLVNAIRGTEYQDPIGRVVDQETIAVPPIIARPRDPLLILGNLVVPDGAFGRAASRVRGSNTGNALLTLGRLRGLATVLSRAARLAQTRGRRNSLLILPELSLPRAWFREAARFVAEFGYYGLIAGLEYLHDRTRPYVRNQVYAVIPGPFKSVAGWSWTKRFPAREEAKELEKCGVTFPPPPERRRRRTVVHSLYGRLSALICSELIEAERVADLLGRVEVVAAPSWNRDTASYDHLIQTVGLQLHSIVAIANNGAYSDCRAWAPHHERWERDLCRLIERGLDDTVSVVMPLGSLEKSHARVEVVNDKGEPVWRPLPPWWPI